MQEKFIELRKIISPIQGSDGWFALRNKRMTASDAGTTSGVNQYEHPWNFIFKKVDPPTFKGNSATYHGKKYEKIATMVYEYRKNVTVEDFGMLPHPDYDYIGASPDGIVGLYKHDGIHLTDQVGTALEIKCPVTRKIVQDEDGDIYGDICPKYYFMQILLQLEVCDLEKCDFWQCNITEYQDREEFYEDTHETERFRSKETDMEKGCVIEMLKRNVENPNVIDHSSHIYPPKITMTPEECDAWIEEQKKLLENDEDRYISKILWWKLNVTNCTLINRDKELFLKLEPTFRKMWDHVLFFRANRKEYDAFYEYVESLNINGGSKFAKKLSEEKFNEIYDKIKNSIELLKNGGIEKVKDEIKKNKDAQRMQYYSSKAKKPTVCMF